MLKNKVVIITGASSGIGKSCALEFSRNGAIVVAAARNIERLDNLKKEIESLGNICLTQQIDVSNELDCKLLINNTLSKFGKIDVLINNAGISMRANFLDVDLSVIKELMDVNFWGTVYCTKYALPHLIKSQGSLVGVISIAGYLGLPGRTGYSASKYAIRGFLDTIRVENIHKNLNVLVVAPGFTASNIRNTARTASGKEQGKTPRIEEKMMSSERCAEYIFQGVKKRKSEIILTFIEGKLSVFLKKWCPRFLDKLIYKHMKNEPNSPF